MTSAATMSGASSRSQSSTFSQATTTSQPRQTNAPRSTPAQPTSSRRRRYEEAFHTEAPVLRSAAKHKMARRSSRK
ncbi:hypothetical protein L5515_012517 [Caenorhabditis briggsae]|uniref:Uncharacterized protein n=1 Tax=Caenorhabditis briggsae TaxID=6238 RepID=A0AAE9ESU5_CAEBR|nr:hypothetical protein L5515_012517 [Caenorhabditis briggsae]